MAPHASEQQFGSLDCIVVDGGPSPTIAVVICHGYGASRDDLAPLAREWIQVLGDRSAKFRFVFPDAPHTLAEVGMPDGRAWWPINTMQMMFMLQTSQFEQLHDEEPPEIADARELLCKTVDQVKEQISGPDTPLVLGGFSQGAMLTLDCALRASITPPQLLIQFSGTVVCRPQWRAAMDRLKETYVFQSHGTVDPILPFSSAEVLHQLFVEGGIESEFHRFVGPHTIDGESIVKTATAMAKLA